MDVFNKLKSASNMTRSFKEREVVFIKVQKICIYNQSKGIVFSLKKKKKPRRYCQCCKDDNVTLAISPKNLLKCIDGCYQCLIMLVNRSMFYIYIGLKTKPAVLLVL